MKKHYIVVGYKGDTEIKQRECYYKESANMTLREWKKDKYLDRVEIKVKEAK